MQKKDVQFKEIPEAPGVYFFRDTTGAVLYVGKATSLRSRVRSYFGKDLDKTRGPLIVKMVAEATSLTWEKTDSVLEALIYEANLIKKLQPRYNSREKDNKSLNYVCITDEDFPRVLAVRGRELFNAVPEKVKCKKVYGPFASGGALKEALSIIRSIFPYRDTCTPCAPESRCKPCFNHQISLCPGVCVGAVSKTDYARTIRHITLLFEGRKAALLTALEREMKRHARAERFEEAARVRKQLFALTHIRETALLGSEYKVSAGGMQFRIEAFDVAHMSEQSRVGAMAVVVDGEVQKSAYKRFVIKTEQKGDIAALEEILRRRFNHPEWGMPSLIVIDGGVAQRNAAQRVLREFGYAIPIVNTVKNSKHKVERIVGDALYTRQHERSIILANAEAHRFAMALHDKRRRKKLLTP